MIIQSARVLDAHATQLVVTIDGMEWTGIRCHLENGAVVVDGDGQIVDAVKASIAAGNTPTPYADSTPTEADYVAAIQAHIDATAKARGYADGVSCASYHASLMPGWATEAQAFTAWRDAVWVYAFGELAKVQTGQRAQPSVAVLATELPAMTWPT